MDRTLSKNESKVILALEWRDQQTVTSAELRSILDASESYAGFLAHRLVQKGWLERVRPGLFQLVPADRGPEGGGDTNPLSGLALLTVAGFFSYGTACTHHGFTEQVFAEVFVASDRPHRPLTVRSTQYVFAAVPPARMFGFEDTNVLGSVVKMANRERALIDALDRPQYAGGIREVARIAAKAAPRVDWKQLVGYLAQWQESAIVQRLGYLLDLSITPWPRGKREQLLGLVHRKSRVHLGPRREWGTAGHLSLPWGIIENVPPEKLYDRQREPGRRTPFPKP